MVTLLHACGGHATELTPQLTLADLRKLPGSQHGLVGLRARADVLHGTLETAPTAEGGYRVRLRIPLAAD
jgi:hypothetical protein